MFKRHHLSYQELVDFGNVNIRSGLSVRGLVGSELQQAGMQPQTQNVDAILSIMLKVNTDHQIDSMASCIQNHPTGLQRF